MIVRALRFILRNWKYAVMAWPMLKTCYKHVFNMLKLKIRKKNEENVMNELKTIGIQETKEVVISVVKLSNFIEKVRREGFSWDDWTDAYGVIQTIPAAIKDSHEVPKEIADMDDEELEILKAELRKFDIPEDKLEEVIEDATEIGLRLVRLGFKIKAL